jgi:hypothetical protein
VTNLFWFACCCLSFSLRFRRLKLRQKSPDLVSVGSGSKRQPLDNCPALKAYSRGRIG